MSPPPETASAATRSGPVCPACSSSRVRASSSGSGEFQGHRYRYLRCRRCWTEFVFPPPPPSILDAMYSPAYVEQHYSQVGREDAPAELLDAARLAAKLRPHGRVLDVGCGAGVFLQACVELGLSAEGFEPNEASARRTGARVGVPVHFGELDAIRARFDIIHLADVLEHSAAPAELLMGARRRLAPGGLLIARGPLESQPTLFDAVMRLRRRVRGLVNPIRTSIPPWHLVQFSLAGWHEVASRCGLRQVEERLEEVQWPAPSSGVRGAVRRASIRLSQTPVGRRLRLGNRVVTVWEP